MNEAQAQGGSEEFILGSSEFASALGLSPLKSRQDLWRQKMGMEHSMYQPALDHGNRTEPVAVEMYQAEYGVLLDACLEDQQSIYHPVHEWMRSTPDGYEDADTVTEFKCPLKPKDWDKFPFHYMPQIQGQMEICGKNRTKLIQFFDGEIKAVWLVNRDERYWAWMLPHLFDFRDLVLSGLEPKRRSKIMYTYPLHMEKLK